MGGSAAPWRASVRAPTSRKWWHTPAGRRRRRSPGPAAARPTLTLLDAASDGARCVLLSTPAVPAAGVVRALRPGPGPGSPARP